ncbi:uncharacterized protein LOC135828710 [Sycon ciliatum]|uniref:uncharacterized protein LOC135828710 n=1 Tax=Sycon ciliatum TaxID=27933 RepID=UPI0031F6202A
MAYAAMSSRFWTASFAFATLAVICTQHATADSDKLVTFLPNFVTNCNNTAGTQSTWFAIFSTSLYTGEFNTISPESAVDTCQRYGFDVMDYDQYKNPESGVESCVSSLLDKLFSVRRDLVSPVYWARRSGNVLMRQDYSQESSGVAYTGDIPPTIICSGSWTTVPYQKYYLSTLQNGLRVKYNAARRACTFYGKRLMSENDIPASQLTNLRQNVFAHLQVKSGAYFLEGGAKILAQNYRGQTSELIMQIFNLYPESEKQILCIQICDHGQLVKGRCICQKGYIGETCEKDITPELISFCARTEESPKLRFPLMGSAATLSRQVSSLEGAQHLCRQRGFGVLDFGDIGIGTEKEISCKQRPFQIIQGQLNLNAQRETTSSISFWSAYVRKIYAMAAFQSPVLRTYESGHEYSVACEGHWKRKTVQSGTFSLATLGKQAPVSYEFAGDACAYINHTLLTPQELAAAFEYDATLRADLDDLLEPGVGPDYILAGGRVKAHYTKLHGPSFVVFLATDGAEGYAVLCGRGNFASLKPAH